VQNKDSAGHIYPRSTVRKRSGIYVGLAFFSQSELFKKLYKVLINWKMSCHVKRVAITKIYTNLLEQMIFLASFSLLALA